MPLNTRAVDLRDRQLQRVGSEKGCGCDCNRWRDDDDDDDDGGDSPCHDTGTPSAGEIPVSFNPFLAATPQVTGVFQVGPWEGSACRGVAVVGYGGFVCWATDKVFLADVSLVI